MKEGQQRVGAPGDAGIVEAAQPPDELEVLRGREERVKVRLLGHVPNAALVVGEGGKGVFAVE